MWRESSWICNSASSSPALSVLFHLWAQTRVCVSSSAEITGCWRNFHNEELCRLQPSSNIVRWLKEGLDVQGMQNAWRVGIWTQNYNKIFSDYQPCQLVKRRKNNVSRTISVLFLRVRMCLENQSVSYIGLPEFQTRDSGICVCVCVRERERVRVSEWASERERERDTDWFSRSISNLRKRTEMVLETLFFPF
jgi:hypothetical protein